MKKNIFKVIISASMALCLSLGAATNIFAAKESSKSTPYGTLRGWISPYNEGNNKHCEAATFIDQPVNRVKVALEAKRTSTGAYIDSDQEQRQNTTSANLVLHLSGYTGTQVTFYGTHDAIHAKGYHVYTSTIY